MRVPKNLLRIQLLYLIHVMKDRCKKKFLIRCEIDDWLQVLKNSCQANIHSSFPFLGFNIFVKSSLALTSCVLWMQTVNNKDGGISLLNNLVLHQVNLSWSIKYAGNTFQLHLFIFFLEVCIKLFLEKISIFRLARL